MASERPFADELAERMAAALSEVVPPADLLDVVRRRYHRRLAARRAAWSAAGVSVAVAAAVSIASVGTSPPTASTETAPRPSAPAGSAPAMSGPVLRDLPLTGPRVRLAGRTVPLPAGSVPGRRPALPAGFAVAAGPGPGAVVAARADGSGVEVALVSGVRLPAVPGRGRAVALGRYRGRLTVDHRDGVVRLAVSLPAAVGHHALVVTAVGVAPGDVVRIARAALGD